jgi:hypothetical protein
MNALNFIVTSDPIGALIEVLVIILIVVVVWAIKQFLGR